MEIIHHQFDTLTSTNGYAKEHLRSYSRTDLTVISAKVQTGGYGQCGRIWHAPPGNICVSLCLFIKEEVDPFLLTRLMAETMQEFFKQWDVHATIKWPNDLLVNGKKLMGILTETVPFSEGTGVVIGFGINVNLTREFADKIDQPATSLFLETGQKLDENAVLEKLIQKCYEVLKKYGNF